MQGGETQEQGAVMLTDEERYTRDWARGNVERESPSPAIIVNDLLAIIERITSPRAVLDEAERLLREREVWDVRFGYGDDPVTNPRIATMLRMPHSKNNVTSATLADAYEALKDGGG